MSTTALTTKAIRNTRKIERPRPLRQDSKRSTVADDPFADLENLYTKIRNSNYTDTSFELVQQACNSLKKYGAQLEAKYKDQLDRYFVSFRDASRDDKLDTLSKLKILEAIELRARGWKQNDQITNYYMTKFAEIENLLERGPSPIHSSSSSSIQQSSSSQNIPLSSGEILKNSGKFSKATKIPGKNYFKDEIMIRNSDSGKVAQGVKERRVQITGPHEEAIGSAKLLIEDTIRRNASPVREKSERTLTKSNSLVSLNSNNSEDSGTSISLAQEPSYNAAPIIHSYSATTIRDYEYTVIVDGDPIQITGPNIDKVRTAKLVLEDYFSGQIDSNDYSNGNHCFTNTRNNRRPLSMYSDLGCISSFNPSAVRKTSRPTSDIIEEKICIPLQRSKSIPMSPTTASSLEDDTFKGNCSSAEEDVNHTNNIVAEYGYQNSLCGKEDRQTKDVYNQHTNIVQSAALRRANYAKASISTAESENCEDSSPTNTLSINQDIRYTRDILLYYAKSPHSKRVLKDLIHIVQDFPYLFKKTPDMFDPDSYKENLRLDLTPPISCKRTSPPKLSYCESVEEESPENLLTCE